MDPKSWGSNAWAFLHSSALHADISKKTSEWKSFLEKFLKNVPCETCQDHADKYLKMHPQSDSDSAFEWTVQFHNAVNSRLGYPQWTLDQARHAYSEKMCTGCDPKKVSLVNSKESLSKETNSRPIGLFFFVCILALCVGWIQQDKLRLQIAQQIQNVQEASSMPIDALSTAM